MKSRVLATVLVLVSAWPALAQGQRSVQEQLVEARPIEAVNSVWIEELTWMEVRDVLAAGKTTAIIPTGGVEQNGPYVALGKHNYILEVACEDLARALGNALCAPIVKLVPEGNIDEPSGHMRFPGTISVREETFRAMLEDVARSLKAHGFTDIVLIGDSGGNQRGMEAVARSLNERWTDARAHYIPEFYDNEGVIALQEREFGIVEGDDGYHDFYYLTVQMMLNDPADVRYEQRVAAGLASVNGVSITPLEKSVAVGRRLMDWRIEQTVKAIKASMGAS